MSVLNVGMEDSTRLVIKSNKSFEEKDFEAWYVAYDMVKLLNNELSKSMGRYNTREIIRESKTSANLVFTRVCG